MTDGAMVCNLDPVIPNRREESAREAPVHERIARCAESGFAGDPSCGIRMITRWRAVAETASGKHMAPTIFPALLLKGCLDAPFRSSSETHARPIG
jgi:hypothetical protein